MNTPQIMGLTLTTDLLAFSGVAAIAALAVAGALARGGLQGRWEHLLGLLGLWMVVTGQYMGLITSPRERMMGEVGRILYVHVPSAWLTMLTFTFTCIFALGFLLSGRRRWDHFVGATAEVGVVLAILLQLTGMLFARPTWGVYWDWDPRLVSTAVMMLSFLGVLTLRSLLEDPDRRATWTAVGAILATTSMIVTYFSVRWWRSIHQMQSSPDTIAEPMVFVLRWNAFAFLFLVAWMVLRRVRLAALEDAALEPPPLPPEVPR